MAKGNLITTVFKKAKGEESRGANLVAVASRYVAIRLSEHVWISEYMCDENDSNLTLFAAYGGERKLSQGEASSESNQSLTSSSNIFFVLD
jgi:hypothetical protein